MKSLDRLTYSANFKSLAFEKIQADVRRNFVRGRIARYSPKSILEIGCGTHPVGPLPNCKTYMVVEPVDEFLKNARELYPKNATFIHGYFEDLDLEIDHDLVVISCLLHELSNLGSFMTALKNNISPNSLIHINVPNAKSMHRLLAVEMGLITTEYEPSATQALMQQQGVVFDVDGVLKLCEEFGLEVVAQGDYMIKPFSHSQMQRLVDANFLTSEMIDGLSSLTSKMPGYGSEIFVEAKFR